MPVSPSLQFRRNDSLPPLAWCAKLDRALTIVVEHGPGVDTGPDYFVEGVWSLPFGDTRFSTSEVMLGSGGRVDSGRVIFTPTTHTLERLCSLRLGDRLFVSNSLAYLLEATGSRLDIRNSQYEVELLSYLRGYRKAVKTIRLHGGRHVSLHYHESFAVDETLTPRSISPPEPPAFPSYHDYIGYLDRTIRRLHDNANAPGRRINYTPLGTISSGYDSPACAVLARRIGCRRALTFAEARVEFAPMMAVADDSGSHIGERLGYEVETVRRDDYLEASGFPEAIFLASGNGGDDAVLSGLAGRLRHSLLFTGFLGDTVWATHAQDPALSREYRLRFPNGGSMQEFRLRVAFVHLPVPLLTFTRHADLERISRSDEMAPWRLGTKYDRPIPRRLVEEAGVPREAFGMEKRAISQPFWLQRASESTMSRASLADFRQFVKRASSQFPLGLAQVRAEALFRRVRHVVRKRLPGFASDPYSSDAYLEATANPEPLRFHWAMEKTLPAYAGARLGRET